MVNMNICSLGARNVYFNGTETILFQESNLSFFGVISLKNQQNKKMEQNVLSAWGTPRKLPEGV